MTGSHNNTAEVLVVGELNIDLILNDLEGLPVVGKEIRAGRMSYTMGSSSAIFASNLSSLGAGVSFKGKLGADDFGEKILGELKQAGVKTERIICNKDVTTGITVVLNRGEDRAMVTYPGAMEHLSAEDISDRDLESADHLHISSPFLQPALMNGLTGLLKRAKEHGLTTSLDPQWDPDEQWQLDLPVLLQHLDVFLPNEQEFFCLTGASSLEEGISDLPESCRIVVKQGVRGATAYFMGRKIRRSGYRNTATVDAIGAGDSFDAGFIYRFTAGDALEECLAFGNMTGAVSTTASGGTAAIVSEQQVKNVISEQFGEEDS